MKYCGVKPGFRTAVSHSLLHCAVIFKCFDVIRFLPEECSDIDVNVTDNHMYTALHTAYCCGHTQIAQYLIQHGADVFAVTVMVAHHMSILMVILFILKYQNIFIT